MKTGLCAPLPSSGSARSTRMVVPVTIGLLALAGPALAIGGWSITSTTVSQDGQEVVRIMTKGTETAQVRTWSKETSMGPRIDSVREDRTEAGLEADANFEDLGNSWEIQVDIQGELATITVDDSGSWYFGGTQLEVDAIVEPAAVGLVAEADRYTTMSGEAIQGFEEALWEAYSFEN